MQAMQARCTGVVAVVCLLAGCASEVDAPGTEPEVAATEQALTRTPIDERFGSLAAWSASSAWTTTSSVAAGYPSTQSGAPVGRVGTCSGRCTLTSAAIDLTKATAAKLELWAMIYGSSSSYDSAGVRVWNGSTWATLGSFGASIANRTWTKRSYDLKAYLGKSGVKVALYGYSLEAGEYAQFDDVKLTVTEPDPAPSCQGGDAVCPAGCTYASDTDCPPPGAIDCRNAATWPSAWTTFENDVLTLVNQRRAAGATCGATSYAPTVALALNEDLREAARCHSLDMATQNYFAHDSLDGTTPWQRIAQAGYVGNYLGENIASGYATPADVMNGWMASAGHCANIMSPSFRKLGVGYAFDAESSSVYDDQRLWTQDFGAP